LVALRLMRKVARIAKIAGIDHCCRPEVGINHPSWRLGNPGNSAANSLITNQIPWSFYSLNIHTPLVIL
jgi:hypothetical protein